MRNSLRVLQVHNKYRPGWGGEDTVADLEADLLERNGHCVERLSVWTGELDEAGFFRIVSAGFGTVWSFRGYRLMRDALARFSPDVVHVHNVFPLLSPSIYWAASHEGVPVVQTMHNYRLACANAILLRNEKPCTDCVGHFPWNALAHRCYGNSFFRTAAVTSMNVLHRWIGTFENKIHAYIAMTDFSKELLERAGLPGDRIFVKPNFTSDPGRLVDLRSQQFVYAGEISRAKGVHLLLASWSKLASDEFKLVILGDGPDRAALEDLYADARNVVWMGAQPRQMVIEQIAMSKWLVLPSLAYENCSMTILEAFSAGTPVIVPNHGSFAAIVSDRKEGMLFSPGDAASLASTLEAAVCACEADWIAWSGQARSKFLRKLTAEASYMQLMWIYEKARQGFASMSLATLGAEKSDPYRYEPDNQETQLPEKGRD
jgi:glycosyltransferase involved in cell wall biosynthesis